MATFSFGFSGDDIDMNEADIETTNVNENDVQEPASTLPDLVPAQRHEVNEWLPTLPSQISYNKCIIHPVQGSNSDSEEKEQAEPEPGQRAVTVARRDVFDIRAQLMVEDSAEEQNTELIAGLEKGDITPNFYEGGFKTWECSIDLAGLVVGKGGFIGGEEDRHVVELGSGTAVPSMTLFAQLLAQTESTSTETRKKTHFTFADYNSAVLRLVTLPNLLLTWNHIVSSGSDKSDEQEQYDMLDITPELLSEFQTDLTRRGITVSFVSGAWSPSFVDLVFSNPELAWYKTLVLASETIYSPASLGAFSETLLELLRRSASGRSRALVAAKKVYFGVGGGVDEFLAVLRGVSGSELSVEERLDVKSAGVGRIVLEIKASQ